MKDGFVRVAAVSPAVKPMDVNNNVKACIKAFCAAAQGGASVVVMPELCITAYTCGDLFSNSSLLAKAEAGVAKYIEATAGIDSISFIGAPVSYEGMIYDAALAVYSGELLGIVPRADAQESLLMRSFESAPFDIGYIKYAGATVPFGKDIIFTAEAAGGLKIGVELGSDVSTPVSQATLLASCGANLIVNLGAFEKTAGSDSKIYSQVKSASERLGCAYAIATAGEGESGTDSLYMPMNTVYQCGSCLVKNEGCEFVSAVIDTEIIFKRRTGIVYPELCCALEVEFPLSEKEVRLDSVSPSPFIPDSEAEAKAAFAQILEIQSRALAGRIERAHASSAIIGVSGGLDSTLALIVSAMAMDALGRDRKGVKAITMPCFGTTARTKTNAQLLCESLGVSFRTIDIKQSVNQHFEDIGHTAGELDVVYENAQARERTQVLMDVANGEGGIVVGTGDMSELALGFATYNGDHMSMYGVNAGVPKTLMRHIIAYYAELVGGECGKILKDILDTPVSPELLPAKDGEITQSTEQIVGPYELHDFFLYYFVRYGFTPGKIHRMACVAFGEKYSKATVKGWLKVFVKRFFTQQFKRSCMPDGVRALDITLSPRGGFVMPSDAVGELWLSEVESIDG